MLTEALVLRINLIHPLSFLPINLISLRHLTPHFSYQLDNSSKHEVNVLAMFFVIKDPCEHNFGLTPPALDGKVPRLCL